MATETVFSTMYTSLDEWFDTRLGTIARIDPEIAKAMLYNGWCDRMVDHYPDIDMDYYQQLYAGRDAETLMFSKITRIPKIVREFAKSTLDKALSTPWHHVPRLCVNIWPYKLSNDTVDLIIRNIVHLTGKLLDVYVIDKSPEDLTPEYVRQEYSVLVMYDYRWLDIHAETLKTVVMPDITILAPMVFGKQVTSFPKEDPFLALTELSRPIIGLTWLQVRELSIAINVTTVETETEGGTGT